MSDQTVLNFPVFEGDFGEPGDQILQNKMVVASKNHPCTNCCGNIAVGERHRHLIGKWGGHRSPSHYRYCAACCKAMVDDEFDQRLKVNCD